MAEPTALVDLSTTLLTVCAAAYVTDGVAPPSRQYVTFGTPVADCDSLVVAWGGILVGPPGGAAPETSTNAMFVRRALLTVWVFRCLTALPRGEGAEMLSAPSVDELNADAAAVLTDAFVVHRGVNRARAAGQFNGWCSRMTMGTATPVEPEGGFGGMFVTVEAELS